MSDLCNDNRFELIEKYKKELIEATNIESAPDEMAVLDDILFRFWQMGWLEEPKTDDSGSISCMNQENTHDRTTGDYISRQDVLGWLLAYHTKSFDLKGRYYPHEVIGWLVTDISKNLFADMRGEQE